MVGRNFIFQISFWWPKCNPRVTWMRNMWSTHCHPTLLILYGLLKFLGLEIWPRRTRTLGKDSILNIFKWNQRNSVGKWCAFLMVHCYFPWVAMALSHGMKYQKISFFQCQFSTDFSEYCPTWVEIEKSANIVEHRSVNVCLLHPAFTYTFS